MANDLVIILAAGEGKRMKSALPKVLHPICGRPMVDRCIQSAAQLECAQPIVIVGKGRDQVMAHLSGRAQFCIQEEQKGTGHAVMMAKEHLMGHNGYCVILSADMPLLSAQTVGSLAADAKENGYAASVLTSVVQDPTGYGRIVRNPDGTLQRIVEEKDATQEIRAIDEINAGVYCFQSRALLECLENLDCANAQQEYYLTDCLGMLVEKNQKVGTIVAQEEECLGVNNRVQLAQAEQALRSRINRHWMLQGVSILNPEHTYIDEEVQIGQDTVIYPGCTLRGCTEVGANCTLKENTVLEDSVIGENTTITQSIIVKSSVGQGANIGPYAYLRPGTQVGDGCKVGDFVELKKARIGRGTKIPHLTYLGDCRVGENCNIACGVVTANYDGENKFETVLGDECFIGCNVNMVAPVRIGDRAYVAAGSTVTEDVDAGALCIARARQSVKKDWETKYRRGK